MTLGKKILLIVGIVAFVVLMSAGISFCTFKFTRDYDRVQDTYLRDFGGKNR